MDQVWEAIGPFECDQCDNGYSYTVMSTVPFNPKRTDQILLDIFHLNLAPKI